jgi:hypothetical protein
VGEPSLVVPFFVPLADEGREGALLDLGESRRWRSSMFFWSPPGGVLSFSKAKKKEPKKNALGGYLRPQFGR